VAQLRLVGQGNANARGTAVGAWHAAALGGGAEARSYDRPDDKDPTKAGRVTDYDIELGKKYGHLTLIDLASEAAAHQPWFNQTLTSVNDAVVRLGVIEGEFHWHKHDEQDEFFLVLEGELVIEVGADTVRLGPHQAYTMPRGAMHKTSAPQRTVILMVEAAGVVPTGD
jgi:mannose-6-phosphate isomerase-like protein (cupin superfamily)